MVPGMALKFQTTRELIRQRALARYARSRGRNVAKTSELIARIDDELERRRRSRLDRLHATVPDIPGVLSYGPDMDAAPRQDDLFPGPADGREHDRRKRWSRLVGQDLPAAAEQHAWPIRHDHCFARILLDNAIGRPWKEVIRPPAWRNTPIRDLEKAIELGLAVLDGSASIEELNANSLRMRGK